MRNFPQRFVLKSWRSFMAIERQRPLTDKFHSFSVPLPNITSEWVFIQDFSLVCSGEI